MTKQHENMRFAFLAVGLMVVVLLATGCQSKVIQVPGGSGPVVRDTINVQGQALFDTSPDQAEVYLRLQNKGDTVLGVQNVNRQTMNNVYDALSDVGMKKKDIETTQYNLHPQYEWASGKRVDNGYQLDHVLKVTVRDLGDVGKVVDEAVQAGMNGVDNIVFSLSREKQQEVDGEALSLAAEMARNKAKSIAKGLDVKLGNVVSVSESNAVSPPVYYARAEMAMASMADEGYAPTPISPSDVTVRATIFVSYAIS